MIDFVILALVACILGAVILFIRREKKAGIRCVGCPDSKTCAGNCGSCGGCGSAGSEK